jgi:plastocyanin
MRVPWPLVGPALVWVCAVTTVSTGVQTPPLGSVRGRINLVDSTPVERPTTRALGANDARPVSERRRAVVYLTAPGGGLERLVAPTRATMDQRDETFVPRVLAVTVGSTVDFPNSDPTYHNVFSLSRARSFDLGRYPAGRSKAVRFDRPGVVRVFCDIHSHMSASILVFAHPFYDVTSPEGTFHLEGVPPGTYVVNAWMENRPTQSQQVTISPQGTESEVDFTFSRRGAP